MPSRVPGVVRRASMAALLLVACAGSSGEAIVPQVAPIPTPVYRPLRPDVASARAGIEALMRDQYATIPSADIRRFGSYLAPDAFYFGATAGEAMVGRDAITASLRNVFGSMIDSHAVFAAAPGRIRVGTSPSGRAGWIADDVTVTATLREGESRLVVYRVTALVGETRTGWAVLAAHWSSAVPEDQLATLAARSTPAPIADAPSAQTEPLRALVRRVAGDVTGWPSAFSSRDDAAFVGVTPDHRLYGGRAVRRALAGMIERQSLRVVIDGGMRGALAPSGDAGWVACNLDVSRQVAGAPSSARIRALFVMERRAGAWSIVQAHWSIGSVL